MTRDDGESMGQSSTAHGTGVSLRSVSADDAGIRLDRWFRRHLPMIPHGLVERWLRSGQVRVDGRRIEAAHRLSVGEVVRVPPHDPGNSGGGGAGAPGSARDTEALRRAILYRDDDIIILNKPAGIAVQGGSGTRLHIDGLLDGLAFGGERPRLVHRLDRDTSGVLVLARSARAAAELAHSFRRHEVIKRYWAIVVGGPRRERGRIDLPLAKSPGPRGERVRAGVPGGDDAITDYRVIARAGRLLTWVELSPLTGRTHQLRVHCAALSMPILGDAKYGLPHVIPPEMAMGRGLHLHACAMALPRPEREPLLVTAPLPPHMLASFRALGFPTDVSAALADWQSGTRSAMREG